MSKGASKRFVIVDGNSVFHRAYHALPVTLTSSQGMPINAVYGFSSMLLRLIDELKPSHVAVCFDSAMPTFRHIEFEEYKAHRAEAPEDLYPQMPKVKEVLDAFGISYFESEGYEADDLIATLATKTENIDEVIIFTADRDTLQLVNDKVKVRASGQKLNDIIFFDKKKVLEKYAILPSQMNDYKALVGDPSDNIPGVAGIGPKTAADLLQKYKNIEGIYAHIDTIADTLREKLVLGKDIAFQCRKLVELDTNAPIGKLKNEDLKLKIDWQKVKGQFEKLHFKSLAAKIPQKN